MTTTASRNRKTTHKTSKSRQSGLEWNLEDFAPEWASQSVERLSSALDELSEDLQSRADKLQSRSEKLRKDGQKRFEKRVDKVRAELRKMPAVKRAEKLRSDLEKRVERNMDVVNDRVLSTLGLARADEIKKLERKIAQLNRKLRTLEKAQAA